MKTICIKTNNKEAINYLLKNLSDLDFENIYFSIHNFNVFTNIFIHYKGNKQELFFATISNILVFLILDIYEDKLIKKILKKEYFYFNSTEINDILDKYQNDIISDMQTFETKENILFCVFKNYLENNNKLYLSGFITFRLKDYICELEKNVDEAVNSYLIDKEYVEFIELLKLYVNSEECKIDLVHLIYEKDNIQLLDKNKNNIDIDINLSNTKYLSDISFSSSDMVLSTLLELLPRRIYIHLKNEIQDDFIKTLEQIFENRISFYK